MPRKPSKTVRRQPPHLSVRTARLRRQITQVGLDGLLVSNPADIRYLSGFCGDDSWLVITRRSRRMISDLRFQQELSRTCPWIRSVMRRGRLHEALAKVARSMRIGRLGFQAEHITVAQARVLAKSVGGKRLKAVTGWLAELRAVKDDVELASIRRAIRIQEQAFGQLVSHIRPGMTEQEVAAYLEYTMKQLGASGSSFSTIVAAGTNSALPHAVPGRRRLKRNQIILIDFGARVDGYCGDLTRVVCLGRMPARLAKVYQIVREAQLAAVEAIKPGVLLRDVDAVARRIIRKAGYGSRFAHSLGHGIGLDIHEQPILSPRIDGELRPGHVVTVEPGIYLPGIGGVRIEDDVAVTERGRRKLSSLPTDLESAMI